MSPRMPKSYQNVSKVAEVCGGGGYGQGRAFICRKQSKIMNSYPHNVHSQDPYDGAYGLCNGFAG